MEENKTLSFIPEFYYDIIARFIPGILILAIYGFEYLYKELNIQTITIGILISYLLGFVLNLISTFLWNRLFFKRISIIKFVYQSRKYYTQSDVWKIINIELSSQYKARVIKMMAEFNLFRSITLIPIIFAFYRPNIFKSYNDLNYFIFSFILLILFACCMLSTYIGICSAIHSLKNQDPSN